MANRLLAVLALAIGVFVASPVQALAQEPEPEACKGTCVSPEDMQKFIELLHERKCLDTKAPRLILDPINIVVDKQGRVFSSGDNPKPYKMKIEWCNYEIQAEGKVKVLAAVQEPPSYGFRFRPKAYTGLLLAEPFRKDAAFTDAIDAGLMVDPLYVKDFNLNFHVGFRSVGAGVGMDIFRSFGVYAGYALAWNGLNHNPEAALWFSFW